MIVVPAIDIKDGKCVRLYQGKEDNVTEYDSDPVAVAERFEQAGAKRLHVVDLDGAFNDSIQNYDLIANICRKVTIPVECGGGIRSIERAQKYISAGVAEVILGTVIVKDRLLSESIINEVGADRVQAGIDFKNGHIAVKGWVEFVDESITDTIAFWKKKGVGRFILTDVTKDGTLTGPNIEALTNIAKSCDVKITAAGGISRYDDVLKLKKLEPWGVDRVISGKAIYEGKLKFEEFVDAD